MRSWLCPGRRNITEANCRARPRTPVAISLFARKRCRLLVPNCELNQVRFCRFGDFLIRWTDTCTSQKFIREETFHGNGSRHTFFWLQRVIIDDKDDWYGFPERVDTRWPNGLASSYAAIARPSYKERFFEIIELVMVNDNFLVESLDERTLSNRGGQSRTTARDISRDNNN